MCWGIGDYGYHVYKINYTIDNFFTDQKEVYFKILDFKTPTPEKVIIKVNGDFDKNAFAKLKNCEGNCVVKASEVIYTVENLENNDFITIYLNYNGEDNCIENNEIIKIKSVQNNNILNFIKMIIFSLIIIFTIIILMIIYINSKKVERIEFKPF